MPVVEILRVSSDSYCWRESERERERERERQNNKNTSAFYCVSMLLVKGAALAAPRLHRRLRWARGLAGAGARHGTEAANPLKMFSLCFVALLWQDLMTQMPLRYSAGSLKNASLALLLPYFLSGGGAGYALVPPRLIAECCGSLFVEPVFCFLFLGFLKFLAEGR